ncbi:TatD family hydrolase [Actinocatenispora thailandica]|nr:TatD family hydrolase [Actinocatenispora thailandica]
MTDSHGRRGDPPPTPAPLPVPVADAHTHLYLQGAEASAALAAAAAVGVDRIVEVGCDVPSSTDAAALAAAHPGVLAAVAIHPNDAAELADLPAALAAIDELAARPRVRAVGETGLDYFRTGPEGRPVQQESFRAHIEIAKRHGKALMIHDRAAEPGGDAPSSHEDIFAILAEGAPDTVIFHCFSGDAEMARRCAEHGWYASFAGNVTFRNAGQLRAAAAAMPTELILVETDAPYLTPMPYRGRPNAPYLVPLTVRALAEVKQLPVEDLCRALSANADAAFGGW